MLERLIFCNYEVTRVVRRVVGRAGRAGSSRRWTLLLALWLIAGAGACAPTADRNEPAGEFVRLMNVGRAHLENRDSASAIAAYEAALRERPGSAPALRNLARAFLLARESDRAVDALERAAELDPDSAATAYLLGIAHAREGRFEQAVSHLETAVTRDPEGAAVRYQLAAANQAVGRHDAARRQLRETVALDPWHGAAIYRLAQYAAARGDRAAHRRWSRRFDRVRAVMGDDSRRPEQLEQCEHTRPELPGGDGQGSPSVPPPLEVRFTESPVAGGVPTARADALAVLESGADGAPTVAVYGHGTGSGLLRWTSSSPAWTPLEGPGRDPGDPAAVAVGDFHDEVPPGERYDPERHALNDLLLTGPDGGALLRRSGPAGFRDVTEASGLAELRAHRARWVDSELDGDLDLLTVSSEGAELWRNRGDGTFEEATDASGLPETGPATDAAAADLDADGMVDLVVARGDRPTLVLFGLREGRFEAQPEPPGPWPAADRVLLDDLDNDGRPDAVLLGGHRVTLVTGLGARRKDLPLAGAAASEGVLFDYDNDGWLDLAVALRKSPGDGAGALRLWRNPGSGAWREVTEETGLGAVDGGTIRAMVAADVDGDGDTDLLVAGDGGLRLLRNDGGNGRRQLELRLVGTKTNPTGYGTRIEVVAGTFRASRTVTHLPVEIGVGRRERLDAVRTIWTNGVVDNRIDVALGEEPLTLVEKNVATGSCPFLYVWDGGEDGDGYRFVTDLLGNAPVGLPLRRGVPLPADPDELVRVGEVTPDPAGELRFEITSEFREVLYLDRVRLLAVDHPPSLEVHPTDRLGPPPFPPSEVWPLAPAAHLRRARADDGRDLTHVLARIDGRFAPSGVPLPPPFRGITNPRVLTLDFGPLDPARPLVLALTGWLQYGDASTNIAFSQSDAHRLVPPVLEVETASGRWLPVDAVVGLPAGKTKTILCDLSGRLPPGARRLRLRTNLEVRWDRIALLERRRGEAAARVQALEPGGAELGWHGFSRLEAPAPGHPTIPDHDRVSDHPPWRRALEGWCTRYGDVLELVSARDGRMAVINSGDAVRLRFTPEGLAPPPPGWRRTFFFYSVGWDKDGDPNVAGGDRVEPLPGEAGTSLDGWRLRYNTRWVPRERFPAGSL
jgi:tetratricopeptide (TPR) repeat protein